MNVPGYTTLADILTRAYNQAAKGKGADRHANELPFDKQPMQTIAAKHGVGFLLGQADKKIAEAHGMLRRDEQDKAVHELLGAINYVAGAILFTEAQKAPTTNKEATPLTMKVGAKVRVSSKTDFASYEGGPGYEPEMNEWLGKTGTVVELDKSDEIVRVQFTRASKETISWWFKSADLKVVGESEEPCDCPLCTLDRMLAARETDPFAKLLKALAAKK